MSDVLPEELLHPRGGITIHWCATAAAMTILAVTTIIGNGAVILAIRRAQRAPSHYPLGSLAAADLLVGLFVVPIAAARELFVFNLNWAICSCWSTLDVLCCTASILSLCALGWERWCGITAPLARAKRARRARIYAILIWPVATAVALPTALIPSQRHFLSGEVPKACTVNTNVGYVFFSISFSFYLPAGVMLSLYARILHALAAPPPMPIRAHRGRTPCPDTSQVGNFADISRCMTPIRRAKTELTLTVRGMLSPKGSHLNIPGCSTAAPVPTTLNTSSLSMVPKQRRATRTIVRLMLLFLVCWTPFFVMLPVDSLCECVSDGAWQWCTWLGYMNSALNPLVYACAAPSVRRALRVSTTSTRTEGTTPCRRG